MSIRGLNRFLGQAVISSKFRQGVLNGKRAELVAELSRDPEYHLQAEEAELLLGIEAHSVKDFGVALERVVQSLENDNEPEPAQRKAAPAAWAPSLAQAGTYMRQT